VTLSPVSKHCPTILKIRPRTCPWIRSLKSIDATLRELAFEGPHHGSLIISVASGLKGVEGRERCSLLFAILHLSSCESLT
jgi:hypothetical protein